MNNPEVSQVETPFGHDPFFIDIHQRQIKQFR